MILELPIVEWLPVECCLHHPTTGSIYTYGCKKYGLCATVRACVGQGFDGPATTTTTVAWPQTEAVSKLI
jgi:hypothetical protein